MLQIFYLVAITVIWVLGIKIATSEGMILESVGNFARKKVDEGYKIWEGLITCEWCLPSFHSIISHGFAFGLGILPFEWNLQLLIRWPLVVFASSFIAGLLWTVYLTLNQIKENNQAQAEYYQFINRRD